MKTMKCAWCKRTISLRGATGKPYRHNNEGALCYGSSQDVASHEHLARADDLAAPPVPTTSMLVRKLRIGMVVVARAKRFVVTKNPWPTAVDAHPFGGTSGIYVVRASEIRAGGAINHFSQGDTAFRGGDSDPVSVEFWSTMRSERASIAGHLNKRPKGF